MKRLLKLRGPAIVVLLVVAWIFLLTRLLDEGAAPGGVSQDSPTSGGGWVGSRAPDFRLESVDGNMVGLTDFKGQAVLVNFWATWCVPCRTEMPELQHVYSERKDQGLVVLAVNVEESPNQVRDYLQEMGLKLPVVLDRDGSVRESYRILGLPSSFFIGRDGVIKAVAFGALNRSALDRRVDSVLLSD